ncbi:MAG TPA: hypothetical protein VMM92_02645 [Thermoanaerobaculia bacterium]|nr:hypothetical protein [Thermoanaerobaculia bacterium]
MLWSRAGWAALGAFAAALLLAFFVADVTHPAAIFPTYLAAAAAPPAERSERLLDYSPLYLGLTRLLAPFGYRSLLVVQVLLHGATSALVAGAVALLAGPGWGLAAGLGVAAYRPFLVYSGIHEPETLVLSLLAAAVLCGLLARRAREAREAPEALKGGAAPRWRQLTPIAMAAIAAACLAAAGLARPQHLLLLPCWVLWIQGGRHLRERRTLAIAAVVFLTAAVLVVPLLVSRALATGMPTIMNPGAVFYEGNGPGATGLTRFAPGAVVALERQHPEAYDYGHVAYRRIAAFALGRPVTPSASNRYWTGLAWESLRAFPGRSLGRFVHKAALALAPYEGQDISIAEQLDRRLRPWFPLGFFVPLLALPWIALASAERRRQLGGPLAIAALAFLTQVALYASARQRLPLALALWIAGPVLAADLLRGRLHASVRPVLTGLLGLALALGLAAATARDALLDQFGWNAALGPDSPTLGGRLVALSQGWALRPELARGASRFAAGTALSEAGRAADSLRVLSPLLGRGADFTIDDKEVGVPEYWAARDLLALGNRQGASRFATAAEAVRPDDPRVVALARQLSGRNTWHLPGEERNTWHLQGVHLPGVDPVSEALARLEAATADGDLPAARKLQGEIAKDFPELNPR